MNKRKFRTMNELSAGGVIYRKRGGKYEFLLGKHSGYHKWVLPKGLVEKGESMVEAAEREVEEEVGVRVRVKSAVPLKTVEYYYFADLGERVGLGAKGEETTRRVEKYQEGGGSKVRVHKRVTFFLMEYEGEAGRVSTKGESVSDPGWEMEDIKWLGYKQAMEILAFETEKEVLVTAGRELGLS